MKVKSLWLELIWNDVIDWSLGRMICVKMLFLTNFISPAIVVSCEARKRVNEWHANTSRLPVSIYRLFITTDHHRETEHNTNLWCVSRHCYRRQWRQIQKVSHHSRWEAYLAGHMLAHSTPKCKDKTGGSPWSRCESRSDRYPAVRCKNWERYCCRLRLNVVSHLV